MAPRVPQHLMRDAPASCLPWDPRPCLAAPPSPHQARAAKAAQTSPLQPPPPSPKGDLGASGTRSCSGAAGGSGLSPGSRCRPKGPGDWGLGARREGSAGGQRKPHRSLPPPPGAGAQQTALLPCPRCHPPPPQGDFQPCGPQRVQAGQGRGATGHNRALGVAAQEATRGLGWCPGVEASSRDRGPLWGHGSSWGPVKWAAPSRQTPLRGPLSEQAGVQVTRRQGRGEEDPAPAPRPIPTYTGWELHPHSHPEAWDPAHLCHPLPGPRPQCPPK